LKGGILWGGKTGGGRLWVTDMVNSITSVRTLGQPEIDHTGST